MSNRSVSGLTGISADHKQIHNKLWLLQSVPGACTATLHACDKVEIEF